MDEQALGLLIFQGIVNEEGIGKPFGVRRKPPTPILGALM
jgi:hypothetical protein